MSVSSINRMAGHRGLHRIVVVVALLGLLAFGAMAQGVDDEGNTNDPAVNPRANACYEGGSMFDKCDNSVGVERRLVPDPSRAGPGEPRQRAVRVRHHPVAAGADGSQFVAAIRMCHLLWRQTVLSDRSQHFQRFWQWNNRRLLHC